MSGLKNYNFIGPNLEGWNTFNHFNSMMQYMGRSNSISGYQHGYQYMEPYMGDASHYNVNYNYMGTQKQGFSNYNEHFNTMGPSYLWNFNRGTNMWGSNNYNNGFNYFGPTIY